ncbi:MAG: 4-hydroxythreonine-4-phosphate dehydrogenase PdxA [Candidatus Competibacteraceae bacterium]|nr:4-hydroxythreonine-4-phosphate dehydrogenase PdxA [Candidatus Competibacteraceae bacterium]MBK9952240.1 4-hydroxythreonine-4-phosphate dehydrogenase PdxA [Candidatus Competibacteraceae bacterium]
MFMSKPIIAISLGDPAGIGPEIVGRTVADDGVRQVARCLVYGDARVIEKAAREAKLDLKVRAIGKPSEAIYAPGSVEVIDLANADPAAFEPGKVQALCGKAAWEYIEAMVQAALRGEVEGVNTGPINKESIQAAHIPHIGHTEMLAALTGTHDPLTMFETLGLRIFFLSRHVSLRKSCDLVTKARLLDYIDRCQQAMDTLGLGGGDLAVAGLNPHSGEHGLFGDEEIKEVMPAIKEAQQRGFRVVGPIGADSVFHQAKLGRYSAVLSLYHDQGHIAAKTLDFERTISLTLGLPFLRTSVDHGTAFDIAWRGKASAVSMVESMLVAARYAPAYRRSTAR